MCVTRGCRCRPPALSHLHTGTVTVGGVEDSVIVCPPPDSGAMKSRDGTTSDIADTKPEPQESIFDDNPKLARQALVIPPGCWVETSIVKEVSRRFVWGLDYIDEKIASIGCKRLDLFYASGRQLQRGGQGHEHWADPEPLFVRPLRRDLRRGVRAQRHGPGHRNPRQLSRLPLLRRRSGGPRCPKAAPRTRTSITRDSGAVPAPSGRKALPTPVSDATDNPTINDDPSGPCQNEEKSDR